MAINVKVNEDEKEEELNYPLLMECEGQMVLMTSHGSGMTIKGNGVSWEIGISSIYWDMDKFKPFTGTIELSNK